MTFPDKTDDAQSGKNALATRQRLRAAARKLFSQANYTSVGIRDIASEAGVNPALISRYFGSKKKLFMEVAASLGEENKAALSTGSNLERSIEAMNAIIAGGAHSNLMTDFRITAFSALDPEVSEIISEAFDEVRQRVMASLTGDDTSTRAELFLSLCMGGAMVVNLLRGAQSPPINVEYMNEFYAKLLAELYGNSSEENGSRG